MEIRKTAGEREIEKQEVKIRRVASRTIKTGYRMGKTGVRSGTGADGSGTGAAEPADGPEPAGANAAAAVPDSLPYRGRRAGGGDADAEIRRENSLSDRRDPQRGR